MMRQMMMEHKPKSRNQNHPTLQLSKQKTYTNLPNYKIQQQFKTLYTRSKIWPQDMMMIVLMCCCTCFSTTTTTSSSTEDLNLQQQEVVLLKMLICNNNNNNKLFYSRC
jgi:hypothetical protein